MGNERQKDNCLLKLLHNKCINFKEYFRKQLNMWLPIATVCNKYCINLEQAGDEGGYIPPSPLQIYTTWSNYIEASRTNSKSIR